MPERRLDVGRRCPHPPYHQGRRDVQARHLAVLKTQIVLRTAVRTWSTCTSVSSRTCRSTIRYGHTSCTLGSTAPSLRRHLLAECASDDMGSVCSTAATCLHPHPFRCVAGALARGTVSRKRDHTTIPPPHSGTPRPTVPGQGLDLTALLVDGGPRRVMHCSEALPLRGLRGFLRPMPAPIRQMFKIVEADPPCPSPALAGGTVAPKVMSVSCIWVSWGKGGNR